MPIGMFAHALGNGAMLATGGSAIVAEKNGRGERNPGPSKFYTDLYRRTSMWCFAVHRRFDFYKAGVAATGRRRRSLHLPASSTPEFENAYLSAIHDVHVFPGVYLIAVGKTMPGMLMMLTGGLTPIASLPIC